MLLCKCPVLHCPGLAGNKYMFDQEMVIPL